MANNYSDWYYLPVRARALIDGKPVPIQGFALQYGIDTMPTCSIDVAIGRDQSKSGAPVSQAIGILSGLSPFTPIEIKMEISPRPFERGAPENKPIGFPEGEFTVFTGFAKAPAQLKDFEGATATLTFEGFGMPGGLAGTTQCITGTTVKDLPSGAAEITARLGVDNDKIAPVLPDVLVSLIGNQFTSNIWASLDRMFKKIVDTTDVWVGGTNRSATTALDRINRGNALTGALMSIAFEGGVATSDFDDLFNRAIATTLSNSVFNAWADEGSDLWEIMLELAKTFYFHFVPAIDFDVVAPITFGLGGEPWRIIDPSEYWQMSISKAFTEQFYAYTTTAALVSVMAPYSPWQGDAVKAISVGHAYIEPQKLSSYQAGTDFRGKLELFNAPSWLVLPGAPAKDSIQPGSSIPDASKPDGGKEPEKPQGKAENSFYSTGMGDGVAGTLLYDKLFEHRVMTIRGRVRFDIAPGSLVRINTVGERFMGGAETLFGHVNTVKIIVEGENAYTEFDFRNVRSENEHEKLTTPVHPLYKNTPWRGALLSSEVR